MADSQPTGVATGGTDRIIREHAGDAGTGEGGDEFPGVAERGAADGAGRLPVSGRAVRASGGGTVAATESEHDTGMPGDICVTECALGAAAAGGAGEGAGPGEQSPG